MKLTIRTQHLLLTPETHQEIPLRDHARRRRSRSSERSNLRRDPAFAIVLASAIVPVLVIGMLGIASLLTSLLT